MTFRIGQKVVCVNADPNKGYSKPDMGGLTVGEIYEIRWIGMFDHPVFGMNECVRLVEIARNKNGTDWPLYARRFRPIVERKTSISIFTEMLTPSPARSKELCGNS